KGENIRDWLHVEDHAEALCTVAEKGEPGRSYLIGGRSERHNIDVVRAVCAAVDELAPDNSIGPREALIRFVQDRPGHDLRYAIDPSSTETELGWKPAHSFEEGLRETVAWYLENRGWWQRVRTGEYRGERLGLGGRV
ncbi:MAG: GDP-mannose 4,6-dehydratase, partial [Gemmatimonadota bacterium]